MWIRARMLKRQKNTSSMLECRHDSGTGSHSCSLRRTFHNIKIQKQEAELNLADANDFNSENDSSPHSPSSGDKNPDISATCHDRSTSGSSCDVLFQTEATLSKDQVKQHAFSTRDVCLANYHHFQLDLQNVINKGRVDVGLFADIVGLLNRHIFETKLNFSSHNLTKRDTFMKHLEKILNTHSLRPKDVTADLVGGSQATMSVFEQPCQCLVLKWSFRFLEILSQYGILVSREQL